MREHTAPPPSTPELIELGRKRLQDVIFEDSVMLELMHDIATRDMWSKAHPTTVIECYHYYHASDTEASKYNEDKSVTAEYLLNLTNTNPSWQVVIGGIDGNIWYVDYVEHQLVVPEDHLMYGIYWEAYDTALNHMLYRMMQSNRNWYGKQHHNVYDPDKGSQSFELTHKK
jgi:hypothetical protein